jgi:hypothetical protein
MKKSLLYLHRRDDGRFPSVPVQAGDLTGRRQDRPSFLPHLSNGISDIMRSDFLIVLKFEKLVPSVSRHVDKHVGR